MNREIKLINKVKHLLRRLNAPRFLHKYGPKTYELYHHLTALLVRHYCKNLAYRRVVKLLDLFGIRCASKSSLQYNAKRIPSWLWNKALELTAGLKHHIIAIDGTGFSRTNPSYHYLRRIDGKIPRKYVKVSAALDTRNKKWCAAKIRVLPSHDIKDAKYLLSKVKMNILVADKGYDANWLHKYCIDQGIKTCIPIRNYGKINPRNTLRKRLAKEIKQRTYGRRNMVESGFGATKRKSGSSVTSKCAKTIRADIYCKLLCHNLFGVFVMT